MAVFKQVNNPDNGDNVTPGSPGYLQFFKQGSGAASGFQVDSEGNVTTPGTITAAGQSVTGPLQLTGATAGTVTLNDQVTGDATQRFTIGADGKLQWGGGALATDVNLYRYAAGGLATDNVLKLAAAATLLLGAAGDVNVYRAAGGPILTTDNSLAIAVAGQGLQIKEGSNAKMGVATLSGGTIVVPTTAVTANSRVFLTAQTSGAAPGALRVSARTAGTSFTITSTSGTDTSIVAWMLVEPA
jgi:hypothetical protein